jgi:hypothetical protein
MSDVLDAIVGGKIWLEYADQNVTFEGVFTPQYCEVLERFTGVDGEEDWYLVKLETRLEYKDANYSHLMIRPRWVGGVIGSKDATAVFIVLVPNLEAITRPFKLDRSLYVAWGLTSLHPDNIKR